MQKENSRIRLYRAAILASILGLLVSTGASAQQAVTEPPTADAGAPAAEVVPEAVEAPKPAEAPADLPPEAATEKPDPRTQALTHYAIARDLLQAGKLRAAIVEYRKAAELDPDSLTVKMELASTLLAVGQRDEAKALYEQIAARHEEAVEAHFQLARMALGQRDQETAGKHFEQVVQAAEKNKQASRFYPLALYYLALSADEKGDAAASAKQFHKLVDWLSKADESFKRDREVGRLLQILPQLVAKTAQVYLLQKQPAEAVAVVRDSAPQMLEEPAFGAALVNSLLEGKHHELALEVALLVQARKPDDARSYELVSRVFEARDDKDALVAKLRELVAAQPDNSIIQLVLGEQLLATDNAERNAEAMALIESVIRKTDGRSEAAGDRLLRSLIDKLLERKRADLALSMAETIRERQPNEIAPYYLLERVHRERGGDAAIIESFRRYLAERSNLPVIKLILGKSLLITEGGADEGLKLLEPLADRASSVSEGAREALVGYYSRHDKAAEVVRLLGRTVNEQYDQGAAMYRLLTFVDTIEDKESLHARAVAALTEVDRKEAQGVYFVLGLLSEEHDPEAAAVHYEKSVEAQPKFLLGHERLSALYMRQDRLMNALDTLRQALYAGSQGGLFFRRMGVVYELVDRDADAVATYRTAMRIDSDIIPSVQYRLANVLARIGQADEGLKILREAAEATPDEVYVWYNLSRYQMDRKQAPEALATIDRAIARMPDRPQLKYIKAILLMQDKQYEAATPLVAELAATEEFKETARDVEVSLLVSQRKFAEAEAIIRKLLEDKPEDIDLLHTLSSIKSLSGDNLESERILQEILAKHPRNPAANNDLGYMWADRNHKVIESERMIRRALQEDPESSAYLDSLGWALYKQERFDEALVYLRRSVRLDNNVDPIVYDHLADALVRAGRTQEAAAYYERVRKLLDDEVERPLSAEHNRLDKAVNAKLSAIRAGRPVPTAEVVPAAERQNQQRETNAEKRAQGEL